jgi:hypothetical protein
LTPSVADLPVDAPAQVKGLPENDPETLLVVMAIPLLVAAQLVVDPLTDDGPVPPPVGVSAGENVTLAA